MSERRPTRFGCLLRISGSTSELCRQYRLRGTPPDHPATPFVPPKVVIGGPSRHSLWPAQVGCVLALLALAGCAPDMTYERCAKTCGALGVLDISTIWPQTCVCKVDRSAPGGCR